MIYKISWILLKNINRKFLTILLLVLLFLPTVANAAPEVPANTSNPTQTKEPSANSPKPKKPKEPKKNKKPKKSRNRKPPSDYSRAGGSRGCPGEVIPLTVLAPNTFVGETTSVRPTFTWFISKAQSTEFRLFELDASTSEPKIIGVPIQLKSTSGINQLSLSEKNPELTRGNKYIWQVSIDCPDSPLIQRAEFTVVQKSSVLARKLSGVTDNSQKAYIYAQQDLWYEALKEALKIAPQGELGQVGSDIVQNLALSDSFIPDKLAPDRIEVLKKEIQQRRNYLEKIAEEN